MNALNRPLVLDGGLATSLEDRGFDLSGSLWSARVLRENPEAIAQVHRAHIAAGAQIITTASYQASREGFRRAGLDAADADTALRASVAVAREASAGRALVAASVGPYGAMLAGGQEYVGRYGIDPGVIRDFHHERLDVLLDGEPDLIAAETIPDLDEAEVLIPLLEDTGLPYWVSFSCRDGDHLNAGQTFASAAHVAAEASNCIAVGVNCTKPEFVSGLLSSAGDKRFVVYSNAGRTWDGDRRQWLDEGVRSIDAATLREWHSLGATIIGGCCGLGEEQISAVAELFSAD